ncbi:MAG: response regulator [Opitutus sp.]
MPQLEILVVDDDPLICEGIGVKLRGEGHVVTLAANGAEALAVIRRQRFDAVVTDILMPERDGLELIAELHRSQPNVRVVAISGGGRALGREYLDAAARMGAHGVLAKPFSFSELASVLARVVADRH